MVAFAVLAGFIAPAPIAALVAGVIAGFLVGMIPGFAGANATAILLPFSLQMPIDLALIAMTGIYAGAAFAGSIPAIILNVPGTAGAAATALDGYPLARQGKAELAIGIARSSSAMGGVIAALITLTVIGPMAAFALRFGPSEMFFVALFGISVIAAVVGNAVWKGLLTGVLGMLIGAMGADPIIGDPRLTFGSRYLFEGVPFVPALIGLFALTEMYFLVRRDSLLDSDGPPITDAEPDVAEDRKSGNDVVSGMLSSFKHPIVVIRSSLIGVVMGVIPGVGTSVANFVSYGVAKRRSANESQFGHGAHEGIIASEASDNGVTGGTMVPTLTLGVPGSATAAVMLAAMYMNGIQPGPRLMQTNPNEAYSILWALLFASVLILPFGILLARPMVAVTRVPTRVLAPIVLVMSITGTFAVRNSFFDVRLALLFGVLGILLRMGGYPVVPLVLGLILGPLAEGSFARAFLIGGGSATHFIASPLSKVLLFLIVILWLGTALQRSFVRLVADRKKSREGSADV